jgi:hypothetical protein
MKVEYINRYKDIYEFTQEDEQTIRWEGPFSYCRYSITKDNVVSMIDPSGGPYISVGNTLRFVAPEFEKLKVTALEMNDGHVIIKVSKDEAEDKGGEMEGAVD